MTKERLSSYRPNKAEIKELKQTIKDRWKDEGLVGNDVIMDYSRGFPMTQSVVGFDGKRYEYLQERDIKRIERLEKDCEEIETFVENIKDSVLHRIFRLYFIDGMKPVSQKEIAKKLHLDRTSISKKIDEFLKLSHNSHNSHL